MWTFGKYVLMVGIAAVIIIPLFKMAADFMASKVSALQPVATYVDKA